MSRDLLSKVRAEIDARMRELRPAVAEYERLLDAAKAVGLSPEHSGAPKQRRKSASAARVPRAVAPPARGRARRGAAQHAIIAALEHGSHTPGELAVVTAMTAAHIRENLRRLLKAGAVTRAKRDGRAAYALSSAPSG
jgi:DNA-binding transcriptional ArsR family regulator